MMTLTLSSDHRVIDGARAAEFLRDLVAALADPLDIIRAIASCRMMHGLAFAPRISGGY